MSILQREEKPYNFKKESINPDAFDQTTYWYDRKGKRYRVNDMNYYHTVNAMNVIMRDHSDKLDSKLWNAMAKHRNRLGMR